MMTYKERAEAPIHDITYQAIVDALDKYPRKKNLFREYCREYHLLEMEEFSEAQALEVLELIDDKTYVLTLRAKHKFEDDLNKSRFVTAMHTYLANNHENYIVLDSVEDCWLIAKRVSLMVSNKNDNSAFQPYETKEFKEYFIVFVAKIADEFTPNMMIGKFITRGCKMVRIYDATEIHGKLEAVR